MIMERARTRNVQNAWIKRVEFVEFILRMKSNLLSKNNDKISLLLEIVITMLDNSSR